MEILPHVSFDFDDLKQEKKNWNILINSIEKYIVIAYWWHAVNDRGIMKYHWESLGELP